MTPVIHLSQLARASYQPAWDDGSKFSGGFGETQLLTTDYWTLRARSSQLFETNLYARGIIRRLVTNEINVGLHLEAMPEETVLGRPRGGLMDWAEEVEIRFGLWAGAPRLCDHLEESTFGALQRAARMEALIAGDVLVVLQQDRRTQLPRVRLVGGAQVRTPLDAKPRAGNIIRHGVELDANGRHVAYWIRQRDGRGSRLPAWGEKSGRRVAWLLYGTERRLDQVRGKPMLSLVLQSLREIDRYRDSIQRKAVINSMLAMFIQKEEERPGTRPMGLGAIRRGGVVEDDGTDTPRTYNVVELMPGLVLDELQVGEKPVAFETHGQHEQLGTFEEAIIQAVAWANEIPPEILRLSFSNNYSASQAAINEFKIYLNPVRALFGRGFCHPIYVEWFIAAVLSGKIDAPGFLEAWRDPSRFDVYEAWIGSDWTGQIKPAVDMTKLVRAYKEAIADGLITRDRASRELFGTKFSVNVKWLEEENEQLATANAPLAQASTTQPAPAPPVDDDDDDDEGESGDDEERAA